MTGNGFHSAAVIAAFGMLVLVDLGGGDADELVSRQE